MDPSEDPVSAMDMALDRSCSGIQRASMEPVVGKLGPSQTPMKK